MAGELFRLLNVTILSGQSLSNRVNIAGYLMVGINMLSVGWDAADLTIQGSTDDITFQDVFTDGGVEKTIATDAQIYVLLTPSDYAGISYLKFRSGTKATPVNQTADRIIEIIVRPA